MEQHDNKQTSIFDSGFGQIIVLALAIFLNPLVYLYNRGVPPASFWPDLSSYLRLGQEMISQGSLALLSWGYIDDGLILPPVYPFLIALGSLFTSEVFLLAQVVTWVSALLFLVVVYLLMRSLSLTYGAIIGVMLISVNSQFLSITIQPLTEATFLFLVGLTLYLGFRLHKAEGLSPFLALAVGIAAGATFLCRHLGLSVLLFLLLWQLLEIPAKTTPTGTAVKKLVLISIGWLTCFLPYSFVLYQQTGQTYNIQHFRQHIYQAETADPWVVEEIERIRTTPKPTYLELYKSRRELRQLTPDATEMIGKVKIIKERLTNNKANFSKLLPNIKKIQSLPQKFIRNLNHLKDGLGTTLFTLAGISLLLPFFMQSQSVSFPARYYLAGFMLIYFALLAYFTGTVSRYSTVLIPFVIIHLVVEGSIILESILHSVNLPNRKRSLVKFSSTAVVLAVVFLFVKPYLSLPPRTWFKMAQDETHTFRHYVQPGAPIFSTVIYQTLVAGGSYRILPNDSLEKIARYAHLTGVKWLIVDHSDNMTDYRSKFYHKSPWLAENANLEQKFGDVVSQIAVTRGGMALYEFTP